MRRICAWCGRDLAPDEPSEDLKGGTPSTSAPTSPGAQQRQDVQEGASSICSGCATGLAAYRKPVLVVSQKWARMYEELVELLKDRPDIQVVLDRRHPAGGRDEGTGWDGPERRKNRHPLALE